MMFTCLYLAKKVEGAQIEIEEFVRTVNQDKYCTVESKRVICLMQTELQVNEIFLIKALKFQLIVYTPFHLVDFFVTKICPTYF